MLNMALSRGIRPWHGSNSLRRCAKFGESDSMLIIRKHQFDLLEQKADAKFRHRALALLVAHFPHSPVPALHDIVDKGIALGRKIGLRSEVEIAELLVIYAAFPKLPELSWAVPILADDSDTPSRRLSRLQAEAHFAFENCNRG